MKRSTLRWTGVAAGFVLVLLYATVMSTPRPSPTDLEHDARGAERACTAAVRERVADARFPFGANVQYLGENRYRLQGTVDAAITGETVRRNYRCVVRYADPGGYQADSVEVWQSH